MALVRFGHPLTTYINGKMVAWEAGQEVEVDLAKIKHLPPQSYEVVGKEGTEGRRDEGTKAVKGKDVGDGPPADKQVTSSATK